MVPFTFQQQEAAYDVLTYEDPFCDTPAHQYDQSEEGLH